MTKLTGKLAAIQCPCDELEGKTIVKSMRSRGFYYLLFSDGTWLHTDYRATLDDMLECLQHEDPLDDPFLEFGLVSQKEVSQHWKDKELEYQELLRMCRKWQG